MEDEIAALRSVLGEDNITPEQAENLLKYSDLSCGNPILDACSIVWQVHCKGPGCGGISLL
eukprot:756973-Hanusia_phi.AAC.2